MERRPGDADRDDLEDMARAGRQQREAEEIAKNKALHAELSERNRKRSRREEAVLWRFAQRASVPFDRLVNAQIIGMFVFLAFIALCLVGITEDRQWVWLLGIGVLVGAVWFPAMTLAVRAKQCAVLRDERNWALRSAFGMTGHMEAIGETTSDNAGLALIVELTQPMRKADAALYTDALASISPKGRIERDGNTVTLHSGDMPTNHMIVWTRDVVGRLLPKLGTYGISRVSMRCEGGGFDMDD